MNSIRNCWSGLVALLLVCKFGHLLAEPAQSEHAIWSTRAMVPSDARSEFMGKIEKFAQDEIFAVRKGQPRGDNIHFIIELERGDVSMTVLNPYDDPTEFDCFLYSRKVEELSPGLVETLSDEFVRNVGEIPGVSFSR